MEKPIILSVDDDPQVLRTIGRDLISAYSGKYKIIQTTSAAEALEMLTDLKNAASEVCLLLCDQRMPEMDGVSLIGKAMKLFPNAKRVLLTAYSDTDAAIRAINTVQLDYFLTKPWDPPEEKLYPPLDELLEDWQNSYIPAYKGIRLIGYQYSPFSHLLKDYLGSSLIPFKWLDFEQDEEASVLLDNNGITENRLPVIFYEDGSFMCQPEVLAIAQKIGTNPEPKNEIYDVVVIGAGPAGLAAAVYGASEGLRTLLIDRKAAGGQAGTSSRIENYLGFPSGLSGADLTRRAISQATRLGAEFIAPCVVKGIRREKGYQIIMLENGSEIITRAAVITTGVDYRKLEIKGIERLTGAGVYYGAAATEAAACRDKEVYILGGGNSAGQSAVYLSNFARRVNIVVRRSTLADSMSAYLIDQLDQIANISVITNTVTEEVIGNQHLERIVFRNLVSDKIENVGAAALYIFIGAKPFTDWIDQAVCRNDKGFIETGTELRKYRDFRKNWKISRAPYLLETSWPGIFAAGDVRAGAMARVASAVGEGSMAISFVHKYLAEN